VRAARLHAVGDLRVHDEPDPAAPDPGWTTVRVGSVGLCGSDLHWFADGGIGENRIDKPVVPGHEFAGVALDGPLHGRRVAVDPAIPCGRCEQCRTGHGNLCPHVRFAGHGSLDGALQELLVWPDHLLVPLPDSVSDDAGSLLEPLGVAIQAAGLAHIRLGYDVLVVGSGPIGALAAAVAVRSGAERVFVSEPLAHRRATALRLGACAAWHPDETGDAVAEATGGRGVDAVLELAGSDAAIATGVAAARPGARIVLGGIPGDDTSTFPASAARRKGLTFVMVRRMHDTYPRALALVRAGLELDSLVTSRYRLDDAAEAFADAASRTGDKVVVTLSPSLVPS
jgi:L-iditol 2-dehydrogenase